MPHKSTYDDVVVPDVDVWGLMFEKPHVPFPEEKHLFTDSLTGRYHTYDSIATAAAALGRGLQDHWFWRKGDTMCFYTPNNIDTPVVTWAVHWAGGVCSPANPLYTAEELAFQMRDSGAAGIVTQEAFLDTAFKACDAVGLSRERVILVDGSGAGSVTARASWKGKGPRHWSDLLVDEDEMIEGERERVTTNPGTDLAFLCYSSGTTGLPKGVRLTHRNIVANLAQFGDIERPYIFIKDKGGDKQLGVLPFFHIYGLVSVMHLAIHIGLPVIVLPRFVLEEACQAIQDHQITIAYIPPPIVLALGKSPVIDQYDVSSLRMLNSGAAPLTRDLVDAVWNRLRVPVKQGYGLSETSPVCSMQSLDEWAKHVGSVGRLLGSMEALIVDVETGKEVPVGDPGELWVRGPNVFDGYHNRPELNAGVFEPAKDGGAQWFKTGDIAYVDPKGHYYITDRLKELIKYKGFQVPPAELEGVLYGHPEVADVCVIGVYDKSQATELPRAYVVARSKPSDAAAAEAMCAQIADWMAQKVTPHKKLRGGVVLVDQIPKSASGKILRRVLRDQVKNEEEGARAKL